AFTVGLRLSVEISSCKYALGLLQSHKLTTMLRSIPCGRDGVAAGNSPAAIRSVQSPNNPLALFGPSSLMRLSMVVMAWPDTMRRAHASAGEVKWPNSLGIVRVALLPS